jgi:DNA-binding NarL/FixJ family response regulator
MVTRTVTQASAAMGLIEAAHDAHGDWHAWCQRLLEGAAPLMTAPCINLAVLRRGEHAFDFVAGASNVPGFIENWAPSVPALDNLDPMWRYPGYLATASMLVKRDAAGRELENFGESVGAPEALGLVAIVDDFSLSVGAPYPSQVRLAAQEKRLLTQVALHLEAGLQLRLQPGTEVAVLSPDGRVLHAEDTVRRHVGARAELSQHVAEVERARTRARRESESAVSAWSALVSGSWGLVERTEADGKRHYAVLETARSRRVRALSPLETQVAELSARGLTGKAVSYALGVTGARVSHALANASLKLGTPGRTQLVRLVAGLLGTAPLKRSAQLTTAERDVLALVHLGWTNAAIATARGRSERTVANQVASLLNKLAAPSRRALASRSLPGGPSAVGDGN